MVEVVGEELVSCASSRSFVDDAVASAAAVELVLAANEASVLDVDSVELPCG